MPHGLQTWGKFDISPTFSLQSHVITLIPRRHFSLTSLHYNPTALRYSGLTHYGRWDASREEYEEHQKELLNKPHGGAHSDTLKNRYPCAFHAIYVL